MGKQMVKRNLLVTRSGSWSFVGPLQNRPKLMVTKKPTETSRNLRVLVGEILRTWFEILIRIFIWSISLVEDRHLFIWTFTCSSYTIFIMHVLCVDACISLHIYIYIYIVFTCIHFCIYDDMELVYIFWCYRACRPVQLPLTFCEASDVRVTGSVHAAFVNVSGILTLICQKESWSCLLLLKKFGCNWWNCM